MCTFSHLHCHSQFSLLDGAADVDKMLSKAVDYEMPALALTDHGNMFGVPNFVNSAKKQGVKPIIGCEFYVTPSRMTEKDTKERYHQVLLAKNMTGYHNLARLSSLGYIQGLYYKPRIDKELLAEHSEGLIATTCCIQSEINQKLLRGGEDEAKKLFKWYLDLFGEDYYIELQRHGLQDQDRCNETLIKWSKEFGVKKICTNDSHYVDQRDSEAHDILLALQTNAELSDPNRFRFTDDKNELNKNFYIKPPDEMKQLFSDVPESLDNTNEIVDKVEELDINSELLLPHIQVPEQFKTMDEYLRDETYKGARQRYGEISQDLQERIEQELGIIKDMGFAGYFLIVQGFTSEARRRGVYVGPGRGSAAGSVVAYCIGIINIDPMKYDLIFERFLNPERVNPPDIDIDFDDSGRQEVIDYVVEKYGRNNVAQIVTYGTMKAKTAIRDVGRVLGVPLAEVNEIAKLFPEKPGLDTFKKVVDPEANPDTAEDIQQLFESENPQVRKMMDFAKVLEGCPRQTGIHAAGVIIAPGNVYDYVPVAMSKERDVITQYDGPSAEDCGLLKMDFLGLKTLSILKTSIQQVDENHGISYNLDDIPLDDKNTYALYQRGDTVGTFQFESDGMRKYLRELKPTSIEDLIAMNALYRPGPMQFIPQFIDRKHGREKVAYPHEKLKDILEPTFGIMVYQEQIMQTAQIIGNFTLGKADILRRAMGKKKMDVMQQMKEEFIEGAAENDIGKDKAVEIFDIMEKFAEYGFNKSHSAAYSMVAYQTAFFKANYPSEFMAAVLTHNMNDIKKVSQFIEECTYLGIPVDPPNVNTGRGIFIAKSGRIQYGLDAIKGVGSAAVDYLVEERRKSGEFKSLFDFTSRVDPRHCGKKMLESLIMAGAFDSLHTNRAQLLHNLDDAVHYGSKQQQERIMNQASLFGGDNGNGGAEAEPKMKECEPWTSMEQLKQERDYIGFFLSGHPLDKYRDDIELFCTHNLNSDKLAEAGDKAPVTVAGIITQVKQVRDKKGRPFAFLTMEDEKGSIEVIAFSDVYDRHMNLLHPDTVVSVEGSVDTSRGDPKIIAKTFDRIENLREKYQGKVKLHLDLATDELETDDLKKLSELFDRNRGSTHVAFKVRSRTAGEFNMNVRKYVVDPNDDLLQELRSLIGTERVKLMKTSN